MKMPNFFGTDGVRGVANKELTPEIAFRLGRVVGYLAVKEGQGKVLIGRDTRISGQMFKAALIAGLTSSGADCYDLGIIPTPAVALICRKLDADYGAVISASHNPYDDNGIKFFDKDGFKLTDEHEGKIASYIVSSDGDSLEDKLPVPVADDIGTVYEVNDAESLYIDFILETVDYSLEGYKIVVDCANGASYKVAPKVYESLGAKLVLINTDPDGTNINRSCGSTHPEQLQEAVLRSNAHLGIAHDGDADRVIFVDEKGEIIDGDRQLAIMALYLLKENRLPGKAIAATVYSNLGLKDSLARFGGSVHFTSNGDRYVLKEMIERGLILGGEQSGHIIHLNYNSTGDGILSAVRLLEVVVKEKTPLSELAAQMPTFPQLLVNVKVKDKMKVMESEIVMDAVKKAQEEIGREGRLYVRPSGTEPLIRIMGEARDITVVRRIVNEVAAAVALVDKEDLD